MSKSTNERSSSVLFIAKFVLLLAVAAASKAGLLIISLLVSLALLLVVGDAANTFSNFTMGFVIVLSNCEEVDVGFWSETMGDNGDGQPLTTLPINAFDDNGEEDDEVEYVFDVVDDSTMFGCTLNIVFDEDDSTS